ncbi:hypothetical protein TKK_0003283 [Trichogramma kaykai]
MAEHVDLETFKCLRNWKGQLSNLWREFQPTEIKRLIADSAKGILFDKDYHRVEEYQRFMMYAIRASKIRNVAIKLEFNQVTLLQRLTDTGSWYGHELSIDRKVSRSLFEIYAGFDENYFDVEHRPEHFHLACKFASYDVLKKFLGLGQDTNHLQRETGESPLHLLLSPTRENDNEVRQMIELLLKKGADPNVANLSGSTPLHKMCEYRDCSSIGTIERFLSVCDDVRQQVNIDARDNEGRTPLHLAAELRRQEVVLLLLRRGADPNVANEIGRTPMHLVAMLNQFYGAEITKMVFEISAEKQRPVRINAQDRWGDTPLHLTMPWGDKKVFKTLLRRGADPNLANKYGTTPLHAVCRRDRDDGFVRILFEICDKRQLTVQINARDSDGKTPLQLAVANLLPNAIDVLLNRGAVITNGIFLTSMDTELLIDSSLACKMRVATGALTIAEQLETRGYRVSRSDALTIMKFFAKHDLFEKSSDLEKSLRDDRKFASQAKKLMIIPSLSLYKLIHLKSEEEEKLLAYRDYFVFAGQYNKLMIPERHEENCLLHLCEKLSRGFFRRWTLDLFYELIQKRLPTECCEQILEQLNNRDLCNISLAAAGQASS